jgi:hypothetical protein
MLLVIATFGPHSVAAQSRATTADLVGTVYDQSRAVLPGATVTATNTETNQSRETVAEANGRFVIPALPPGVYRVKAELPGFAPHTEEDVVLQLGAELELQLTLHLATFEQQVAVAAAPRLIDRAQTAVASVVTQQQINSLPINGRDFISFSVITPGVTRDNTPQQGASATSGLTFAGQRARSNNITVDGLDNNDITVGSVRATFSQEAVREFQVVTNSYTAEFGKASGGVVNIVTKSGTNQISGNGFVFLRDASLNSKGYFERFTPAGDPVDREKAPYSQEQFGGTFGGPIQRDRMFFFGSFERLDVLTNNVVTIDDTTPILLFGEPIGTAVDVLRRAGFPVETGHVPYAVESNQLLLKVDRELRQGQHAWLRYNYASGTNENIEPWGGLVARSRGALLDNTDNMLAGSHMSVLSSRIVNELRFQFARRDQQVNSLDPSCGGPCSGEDQGGPTLEILGVASVGRNRLTPQPRLNDRYELLDTVSLFRGNHQWRAGFDFNYVNHKLQALPLHFGGRYLFQSLPAIPGISPAPVTGIQALALGLPAAYIQGYGQSSATYGYRDLSLFAQDDWRVSPEITLKLGVRYQSQFWPDTEYTTPGVSMPYTVPDDRDNVAPRVALAWDLTGDSKTLVRGAYGVYFDNLITGAAGIAYIVNGSQGVRTLVARFPATIAAWNAPRHQLPEPGAFPSLVISLDPGLTTSYAHHATAGVDRELPGQIRLSANYVHVRGLNQLGTIDYNPIVPTLGAGRRPLDVNGIAGTSASVLQYTSFGDTWYRGLVLSAGKRFSKRHQFLASYTLSRAEDTSTDFSSGFLPQDNGRGRDPGRPTGLPIDFDPERERGPSLQDQRHHLVLSGAFVAPFGFNMTSIVNVASGRPYNVLAGADLNADGDGGTIPGPDRARTNPSDPATAIRRNSGTMPMQATVDVRLSKEITLRSRTRLEAMVEVFNLFNRTNFTDINNVFGTGPYPTVPLPAYGQFVQAAAPRQAQVAMRITF